MMMKRMVSKRQWTGLAVCLAIPLAAGGFSAFWSMDGMKRFEQAVKPPLTPPGWVFAIAWAILYLMMGYASYQVWRSGAPRKRIDRALAWYGAQLAANFWWSPLFFRWEMYLAALFWLVLLLVLAVMAAIRFGKCQRKAGYLMILYLCWLLFAGYLNAGVWLLNR